MNESARPNFNQVLSELHCFTILLKPILGICLNFIASLSCFNLTKVMSKGNLRISGCPARLLVVQLMYISTILELNIF